MIQLLRQFHALRSSLGVAVENALAVTHSLPDHNHSREEVRRILVRVRPLPVPLTAPRQVVACVTRL